VASMSAQPASRPGRTKPVVGRTPSIPRADGKLRPPAPSPSARKKPATVGEVRLFGLAVTHINCRVLITGLTADGAPDALAASEQISEGLAGHGVSVPLTPPMRDAILRSMARSPPSGLVALRNALASDKRARS
jgi:hypothetical protein